MNISTLIWRIPLVWIVLAAIGFTYYLYRARQAQQANARPLFLLIFITTFCLTPAYLLIYFEVIGYYVAPIFYIIGIVAYPCAELSGFLFIQQMLRGYQTPRQMFQNTHFRIGVGLICALALVTITRILYLDRPNVSLTNVQALSPASDYLFNYALYYGTQVYLCTICACCYWLDLRRPSTTSYTVRRLICMTGCGCAALFTGLALVNVPLIQLGYQRLAAYILSIVLFGGATISFVLLSIGFATPEPLLRRAVQPIEQYLKQRTAEKYDQLEYLHKVMIRVVPVVMRTNTYPAEMRHLAIDVHIAEARHYIWSHQAPPAMLTPQIEAKKLAELLKERQIFTQLGQHSPPALQHNDMRHNLLVVKHLKGITVDEAF